MTILSRPVLVVDDDAAVRHSLKFALELEGLEVRLYSGGEALLSERSLPADGCLVIDYHMPAMDGLDLLGRLRRRDVHLPAILIAAEASEDLRRRARAAGIRAVLEKPLDDSSLLDSIRYALGEAA